LLIAAAIARFATAPVAAAAAAAAAAENFLMQSPPLLRSWGPGRTPGEPGARIAAGLQPSLQQSGHRRGPGRRPCGIAASKTRIPAGAAGAVPGSHPAVPAGDSLTRML